MFNNIYRTLASIEAVYDNGQALPFLPGNVEIAIRHHLLIENLYKQMFDIAREIPDSQEIILRLQYQDTIHKVYQHYSVPIIDHIRDPLTAPYFQTLNASVTK